MVVLETEAPEGCGLALAMVLGNEKAALSSGFNRIVI
jgi:hypothetical protein